MAVYKIRKTTREIALPVGVQTNILQRQRQNHPELSAFQSSAPLKAKSPFTSKYVITDLMNEL